MAPWCCGSRAALPAQNCTSASQSVPRPSQIRPTNLQQEINKLGMVDHGTPTNQATPIDLHSLLFQEYASKQQNCQPVLKKCWRNIPRNNKRIFMGTDQNFHLTD